MNKEATYKYYLIILVYTIVDFLFGPGYTTFMQKQGLHINEIGLVFIFWNISVLFLEIPSGGFADKYGRKKVMVTGFIIWGLGLLSFSRAHSILSFIIAFFLIAIGMAFISGTPEAWYVSKIDGDENLLMKVMPKAQSLSLLVAVFTGFLFTIIVQKSLVLPYFISGGLALIFAVFMIFSYQENYSNTRNNNKVSHYIISSLRNIKNNKTLRLFFIKSIFLGLPSQIFILSWQLFILGQFGIEKHILGIIMALLTASLSIGYFISGKLLEKFNGVKVSIWGGILVVVSSIILCFTVEFWMFIAGAIFLEVGLGIEKGSAMVWIQNEIEEDCRSSTLSVFSLLTAVDGFLASFLLSVVVPIFGFGSLWVIAFLSGLLGIWALYRILCMKAKV